MGSSYRASFNGKSITRQAFSSPSSNEHTSKASENFIGLVISNLTSKSAPRPRALSCQLGSRTVDWLPFLVQNKTPMAKKKAKRKLARPVLPMQRHLNLRHEGRYFD